MSSARSHEATLAQAIAYQQKARWRMFTCFCVVWNWIVAFTGAVLLMAFGSKHMEITIPLLSISAMLAIGLTVLVCRSIYYNM
jgi:hypothetical protein